MTSTRLKAYFFCNCVFLIRKPSKLEQEESTSDVSHKEKSDDPTVDLFPDDDTDERAGNLKSLF